MADVLRELDTLFDRIAGIVDAARQHVVRSVNTAMVHAYWLIGREIVEVQQRGNRRAEYGERLVRTLAERLRARYGKGFGYASVKRMKQLYVVYPQGSAVPEDVGAYQKGSLRMSLSELQEKGSTPLSLSELPTCAVFPPQLSWSHYLALIRIRSDQARSFYEIETVREGWSIRELERQIGSLLFERLSKSRDKEQVMTLAREGQTVAQPGDIVKDPFVLEFLGLEEHPTWRERDLEQAIIDRLEAFLLELGKGFCFVGRQKRITIEGDHYYVDLAFYNRLLNCFVLIDLKLGKLTHQDLGQMQMYVNYFDRSQRTESEAPTVGIVLCSDKNDAMVRITLPEGNTQIHASRYQLYLPTEDEFKVELERERAEVERVLREIADREG